RPRCEGVRRGDGRGQRAAGHYAVVRERPEVARGRIRLGQDAGRLLGERLRHVRHVEVLRALLPVGLVAGAGEDDVAAVGAPARREVVVPAVGDVRDGVGGEVVDEEVVGGGLGAGGGRAVGGEDEAAAVGAPVGVAVV